MRKPRILAVYRDVGVSGLSRGLDEAVNLVNENTAYSRAMSRLIIAIALAGLRPCFFLFVDP